MAGIFHLWHNLPAPSHINKLPNINTEEGRGERKEKKKEKERKRITQPRPKVWSVES